MHREEDVSFLPELAVWPELKLEELVSKLAFVSNIVAQVEVVGHVDTNLQILFQMIMLYFCTAFCDERFKIISQFAS